jgi:hypothetical protein
LFDTLGQSERPWLAKSLVEFGGLAEAAITIRRTW